MKYILKHLCQVFRAKVNLIMLYDVCVATIIFSANDQLPFYTKAVWRETNKGLLEKFITRHFQTVPKVYRPVYNMFRFMKIVICVIFTVYKPEKQVHVNTGMKQRSFVLIFRNPSGEEPEVPLNHRIPDCNTLWFRPSVSQY